MLVVFAALYFRATVFEYFSPPCGGILEGYFGHSRPKLRSKTVANISDVHKNLDTPL